LLAGGTVVAALVAATLAGFSGTAPAAPEIPQIGPGYSENTAGVTCIQKVLGVDPTPAPYGTFGTLTYEAVKGFQGQHGLPQIGGVGPATGALLIPLAPSGCAAHLPSGPGIEQPPQAADADEQRSYPGCPLLLEGNQNRCVERLQHDLNAVNSSYNLPETGFFGPLTRTAVLDFQGRNKLPADGNVGSETADLLADQATSSSFVPSPRPGAPLSPINPDSDVLAERCPPQQYATIAEYLTGASAPPNCFPYQPDIEDTEAGRRALDPFSDGCSGRSWEDDLFFDRNDACSTHDYGYDLIRFGVDTFGESNVDNYFYQDMIADCEARVRFFEDVCLDSAGAYRAGVRFGSARPGDHISTS